MRAVVGLWTSTGYSCPRVEHSAQLGPNVPGISYPSYGKITIHGYSRGEILASAVWLRSVLKEDVVFACADARLLDAARAERLVAYEPEQAFIFPAGSRSCH
jgi:hypothetical protein